MNRNNGAKTNTMPTVYIVNEPDESRVPDGRAAYDTNPARAFGRVEFVFPVEHRAPVRNPEAAVDHAHKVLADVTEEDMIVWAGGDPLGLVIVASILADKTDGKFTYLKWDRAARAYAPVQMQLFEEGNDNV